MVESPHSTPDLTSSYAKMFLEKMALLNRTFLDVIEGHVREVPDVDLSPTVRDYLAHVKNLDRIYGSCVSESTPNAPLAFAFDTTNLSTTLFGNKPSDTTPNKLGLSSAAAPKFSFGNSKVDDSNREAIENERRGRKRAKRGGPDEREDEVIISHQAAKVTCSLGISSTPTAVFSFGKQSSDDSKPSCGDQAPVKPLFSFGATSKQTPTLGADSTDSTSLDKDDAKETSKRDSSSSPFGQPGKAPVGGSGFSFGAASSADKSAGTPLFTFGKTTPKESGTGNGDQATSTFKTPVFPSVGSLPGIGGKDAKPLFSFGSSANDSSNSDKAPEISATTGFKFGPPPTTNESNESDNKDGENEEEYVPPKVEAVFEEEPDAILSSKCSVFVLKGKSFEKLGVGQLHVKKTEGKDRKILLIRAATTIGTIWLNAFIDKNMKCTKADDVRLKVSCVTEGHPSTHLIRLPSAGDRERIENELSHDGNEA